MKNNEFKPQSSFKIYIITAIIALAVILLVCGLNGLFTTEMPQQDVVKYVCNAFFVAGVLVLGIAGLTFSSKHGAFDGFGYAISSLWDVHKPSKRRLTWTKKETYQEYVERKHSKDKNKQILHLLIIGGILLIVAIILLVVYNCAF